MRDTNVTWAKWKTILSCLLVNIHKDFTVLTKKNNTSAGREQRTTKPIMSVWQQTFGHASNEKREKLSWREGATRWEKQRGRADEKEEELLARLLAVHGANGGGAEERRWVSTTVCLWPRGRADNVNSNSVKANWDVTPSCTHPTSQTCSCLTFILKFFTRSGKENKGVVWRTQQKYKLLKRFSELRLFVTHPSKSRVQEGLPWCHVVEFTLTLCTQIHDVHPEYPSWWREIVL